MPPAPLTDDQRRSTLLQRVEPGWGGCWLWTGPVGKKSGYIHVNYKGRRAYAHRVMWALTNGEIPDGLHVDHTCNVRRCLNPAHLEAVTQAENNRRMGERNGMCRTGLHQKTAETTTILKDGTTRCRLCVNIGALRRYYEHKERREWAK